VKEQILINLDIKRKLVNNYKLYELTQGLYIKLLFFNDGLREMKRDLLDVGYYEELSTNWADRIDRNAINYAPMMLTPNIEHLRIHFFPFSPLIYQSFD